METVSISLLTHSWPPFSQHLSCSGSPSRSSTPPTASPLFRPKEASESVADPVSGNLFDLGSEFRNGKKIRIWLDKNSDPESGINLPDPQHCLSSPSSSQLPFLTTRSSRPTKLPSHLLDFLREEILVGAVLVRNAPYLERPCRI
jgi:hypothetical protein